MNLHLTFHKAVNGRKNKMDGMISINTNSLTNPFCLRMRQEDSVCAGCYNKAMEKVSKQMNNAYQRNAVLLCSKNYQPEKLNYLTVRFHSAGELYNKQHYENILKLVKHNPQTLFTLWTKRSDIVKSVKGEKPENLILVYSSYKKDTEEKLPVGFDKVFTVYYKKYIEKHNVEITCKKQCNECLICYSKNDITYVRERIK